MMFYPNWWGRVLLESAEDLMDAAALRSLLHLARLEQYIEQRPPDNMAKEFPAEHVSQLAVTLYEMGLHRRNRRVSSIKLGQRIAYNTLSATSRAAASVNVGAEH